MPLDLAWLHDFTIEDIYKCEYGNKIKEIGNCLSCTTSNSLA